MLVREVMTTKPPVTRPDASLRVAALQMRDANLNALPVCGENDKLVGYITERDIVLRAIAEGRDPNTTQVREVMTESVLFCYADQETEAAAGLMMKKQVRRIFVINREKRLVGIVSYDDLGMDLEETTFMDRPLRATYQPVLLRRYRA